ncbi:carboxypeptidase regulatory-like domain-containing protein [Candidatus Cloacimonadota bacterium]
MKRSVILLAFLLPVILSSTVIPGGDVSGVWDLAGSPYYVDGEITIQSGSELNIEAGVDVIFNDHYKFYIYGRIVANGTEADSIKFMPLNSTTGWHGLRFYDGNISSLPANEISYCQFKRGYGLGTGDDQNGGAIFCSNTSNLTIENSYFFQNYCEWDGGAIYLGNGSNVQINGCMFLQNDCGFYGGSIIVYGSDPILNGCTFKENTSSVFAAGFSFWNNSNPELYNCTFIDNYAGACTGVYGVSSTLKMANVLFINNETQFGAGAACGLTSCTTEATNVTAGGNVSALGGGAFWVNGGTLNVYNSILWNNLPENILVASGNANASNCCISDGFAGTAIITDDPQFIDYSGYNLRLADNSPCIDTGDEALVTFPLPLYDLDGNDRIIDGDENGTATIDMGAYEFVPASTTGYIAGTVTDSGGNFLVNAEITAGVYTAQTGVNGEYEIEAEAGDYTVSCYLEGYEIPDNVQVTVIAGETVIADFILELIPTTGFIVGTVTDSEGTLLENAEITAGSYTTQTDVNGEYEIEVEAGDYTVSCFLAGYEVPDNVQVTVLAGESSIADFVLVVEVGTDDLLLVNELTILGNYPNPFNPNTTISFAIPQLSNASIIIYNAKGQLVKNLFHDFLSAGQHNLNWNGFDENGKSTTSGIYFYQIKTETETQTGKMIMLK